jgi:hypothetical protein
LCSESFDRGGVIKVFYLPMLIKSLADGLIKEVGGEWR